MKKKPLIEEIDYNVNTFKRTHVKNIILHTGTTNIGGYHYPFEAEIVFFKWKKQPYLQLTKEFRNSHYGEIKSYEEANIELTQNTIKRLIEELTGLLQETE